MRKLARYSKWLAGGAAILLIFIFGTSALLGRHYPQYTPAYRLWKHHAFPFTSFVPQGLFMDVGHDRVEEELLGKGLADVQSRFGGRFVLDRAYEGTWPQNESGPYKRIEHYQVPDTWLSCFIVEGKCVAVGPSKG